MEWVEAEGKSVDDAVAAGMAELKIASREEATIEVLQEPKAGFLGMGGQLALVKVTPKPRSKSRRRRRHRKSSSQNRDQRSQSSQSTSGSKSRQKSSGSRNKKSSSGRKNSGQSQNSRNEGKPQSTKKSTDSDRSRPASAAPKENTVDEASERSVTVEEQAEVAAEFLGGLLDAFGLEGEVNTRAEDEILYIDISGDQTEALVGAKGAIMQSVLELTRTVIQRKTYGAPRMRIVIAGYTERRREALKIYTGKLVEKVLAEDGEIMLEPMNPADRKVIHDAVADHDGVRSFSEGEDPHRSVVIAPEGK